MTEGHTANVTVHHYKAKPTTIELPVAETGLNHTG